MNKLVRVGIGALAALAAAGGCLGTETSELEGPHNGPIFDGGLPFKPDVGSLAEPPVFGPPRSAEDPPPPISGGTLLVRRDGRFAVASDPDRDLVHVVDLRREELVASFALRSHDEPGRLVEDDEGRVHVAMRRGGSIVSLTRTGQEAWTLGTRRDVCRAPRGIDFDPKNQRLLVGCAEGHVAVLPADPARSTPVQHWPVESDVRDVVVTNDAIFVSLFRAAQVWVLNEDGSKRIRVGLETNLFGGIGAKAGTAWRMQKRNDEVVVLFQNANPEGVSTEPGGYGGFGPCRALVMPAVARVSSRGQVSPTAILDRTVLGVDFALSSDLRTAAVVAPGNAATPALAQRQLQLLPLDALSLGGCQTPGSPFPITDGGLPPVAPPIFDGGLPQPADGGVVDAAPSVSPVLPPPEPIDSRVQQPRGEAIAVALTPEDGTLVQIRQPAGLLFANSGKVVSLSTIDRVDSGHEVFHSNAGAGIACASCHPEGGEDAQTWTFIGLGKRRTQSLRGGIMSTAPFHWNGELPTLDDLMGEVFQKRMQGPPLSAAYVEALGHFVDKIPDLPSKRSIDDPAAQRGKLLFESAGTGCTTCHNGPKTTNNVSMDVGTGELFQVPTLKGVSWRAPFMHDGCAPSLSERFTAAASCSGGDRHGVISKLTPEQVADLVAYMETL